METLNLKCNNCGAGIQVPPKAKFLTCAFCKSSLTIKRTGSAIYTEVLGEIKDNTDQLIQYSEVMVIEQEIERLDRDWYRGNLSAFRPPKGSTGKKSINLPITILLVVILGIMIIMVMYADISRTAEIAATTLGFILIGLSLFFSIRFSRGSKQDRQRTPRSIYLRKREDLLQKLEEIKSANYSE